MRGFKNFKNCASMINTSNAVAETTVGATYNKVTAFNAVSLQNEAVASTVDNTITIKDAGIYRIDFDTKASGLAKTFVYAIFVNGAESVLNFTDNAEGHASGNGLIELPKDAVIDVRQKSTDLGTSLTVKQVYLTVERLA